MEWNISFNKEFRILFTIIIIFDECYHTHSKDIMNIMAQIYLECSISLNFKKKRSELFIEVVACHANFICRREHITFTHFRGLIASIEIQP